MLSLKNMQFMEARVQDELESNVNTANNNISAVPPLGSAEVVSGLKK